MTLVLENIFPLYLVLELRKPKTAKNKRFSTRIVIPTDYSSGYNYI